MFSSDLSMFQSHLPDHCSPASPYLQRVSSAFNTCVPTPLAFLSTSLGIFSIIAWLFAQLPQIYENYKLQTASGLSIYFLAVWLLGDVSNWSGAVLTGQASWQVGLATYYVIVDICLFSQFCWYTHIKPWRMRGVIILNPDDGDSHSHSNGILNNGEAVNSEVAEDAEYLTSNGRQAEPEELRRKTDILAKTQNFSRSNYGNLEDKDAIVASSSASSSATGSSRGPKHSKSYLLTLANAKNATGLPASPAANVDLPISTFVISSKAQVVGQVLSWASTALYLGSRLPQILKNSNRRSTAGVSLYMFVATFCGNFFYSAAIIANPLAWDSYGPYGCHGWAGPEGSDQSTWVKLTLPFWLGAAGVLVLDAYVIFQFIAYREKTEKVEMLVEDSRGRTTWKAVSGWMRGWVPSPGRRPTNDGDEDEWRPLLGAE